jgi:hypothetical protein
MKFLQPSISFRRIYAASGVSASRRLASAGADVGRDGDLPRCRPTPI